MGQNLSSTSVDGSDCPAQLLPYWLQVVLLIILIIIVIAWIVREATNGKNCSY